MKIALILLQASEQPKLFGQYNELVLLLIGFALTTIIGSIIAAAYQRRHWKRQAEFQQREWDRQTEVLLKQKQVEQAQEIFSEISNVLEGYVWVTMKYIHDNSDSNLKDYKEREAKLMQSNYHSKLLELYFGESIRDRYSLRVIHDIALFDDKMPDKYEGANAEKKALDALLGNVIIDNLVLFEEMAEAIKTQNIGTFRKDEHLPDPDKPN